MSDTYRLVTRDDAIDHLVIHEGMSVTAFEHMEDPRKLLADEQAEQIIADRNAETRVVKVAITLFGETREFELDGWPFFGKDDPRRGMVWRTSVPGLVATIGAGSARYPDTLLLTRLFDTDRPRPGTTKVTDQEGRVWTFHLGTCVRNRQARIVGWADTKGVTNSVDQTRH